MAATACTTARRPFSTLCPAIPDLYFSVLQTAYNLIGTGLLPWTKSRRAFAMAYRSLLARQNIGLSSPNLTYVGSVVSGDAYS